MGSVHRVQGNQASSANISIAMSLSNGLNAGPAQAFAGPGGAYANAGGLGSMAGFGGPNGNALAGNFGGPQNPYQAGFQQGQKAAKMQRLMKKMRKLMAKMGAGMPGFGGPGFGGPGFGVPGGGAQAVASAGGAYAVAGTPRFV